MRPLLFCSHLCMRKSASFRWAYSIWCQLITIEMVIFQMCTQTCIQQQKWYNFCLVYISLGAKELILSEFITVARDSSLTECILPNVAPNLRTALMLGGFLLSCHDCMFDISCFGWVNNLQYWMENNSLSQSHFSKPQSYLYFALKELQLLCGNHFHRAETSTNIKSHISLCYETH